jgi:hypothetical protein
MDVVASITGELRPQIVDSDEQNIGFGRRRGARAECQSAQRQQALLQTLAARRLSRLIHDCDAFLFLPAQS